MKRILRKCTHGEIFPLSRASYERFAAAVFCAGFASAPALFSTANREHIERAGVWSDDLALLHSDCIKAAQRGKEPVKRAPEFRAVDVVKAKSVCTNADRECPHAWLAAVVNMWWALREALAAVKLHWSHISSGVNSDGISTASLNLPLSKTDPAGRGKVRALPCCCSTGWLADGTIKLSDICGVCALPERIGIRSTETGMDRKSARGLIVPLIANLAGDQASKQGVIRTRRKLQHADTAAGGWVTGHSARG